MEAEEQKRRRREEALLKKRNARKAMEVDVTVRKEYHMSVDLVGQYAERVLERPGHLITREPGFNH